MEAQAHAVAEEQARQEAEDHAEAEEKARSEFFSAAPGDKAKKVAEVSAMKFNSLLLNSSTFSFVCKHRNKP